MIENAFSSLIHGLLHLLDSTWWLFAIILAVKFGPRIVRGILLQRGGYR